MASFDQKLRTLRLMEILLERTDDTHMLNASELCTILDQEYGISTDRRTIYTEMEILDKFGLDIQQKKGKNPGYYIGARDFELPELKLLVDAVQSSKFITEKKSKELITKLEKLCCRTDAAMLSKYVFIVNRPKTENETVYYNVDYIHTAIYENKEIKFHYAEWTVKKELKLKKDGAFYVVSPWALEERIKKDRKAPGVILSVSKSDMLIDLVRLVQDEVIGLEDLSDFSEDVQERVKFMVQRW